MEHSEKTIVQSVGKDVEKLEPFLIVSGKVKWDSHIAK